MQHSISVSWLVIIKYHESEVNKLKTQADSAERKGESVSTPSAPSNMAKGIFLNLWLKPPREILEEFSTTFLLAEGRKVPVDAFSEIKGR